MTEPSIDAAAFRDFERAATDRVARPYLDFFAPVTSHAIEPLLDAAGVGVATSVLDVASGPGIVAARAAARGAAVVGADLSPNMVTLARERQPGIEFHLADAEELPFPDGAFGAVVCNFGIGHFPCAERAMAELARVVAPGGRVAVSWWDVPGRNRVNAIFVDAASAAGVSAPSLPVGPPPWRFSEDAPLLGLLEGAGLRDSLIRSLAWVHSLPSVDEWWERGLESLPRASAAIVVQPPEIQARVRAVFEELARPYVTDRGVEIPCAVKIASARRA